MIDIVDLTIWGRLFSLPIVYDCLSDGVIYECQVSALEGLINHPEWIEWSKAYVEDYCKDDVRDDDENLKKDNVFSYIKPQRLFVNRKLTNPVVSIMCNYRYDPEHGLAIAFSNDGKITVGSQDIAL